MSWVDALKGSLSSMLGQAESAAIPALVKDLLGGAGLQTVLAKLQEGGMSEHVRSWLDANRQNLPLSVDQLRAALGNEQLQRMAASVGLPVDKLLAVLAEHLPQATSATAAGADDASEGEGRQ